MTKWLVAGLSLPAVVKGATLDPAAAIGWADRIGSLAGQCHNPHRSLAFH
jgi:imidazolonepropionase-like amidohydrolase